MSNGPSPLALALDALLDMPECSPTRIEGGLYIFNFPGDGTPPRRDEAVKMLRPKVSLRTNFELTLLSAGVYQAISECRDVAINFSRAPDARWELVMQDPNPDMLATAGFNTPYVRLYLRDFQPYGEARVYALRARISSPPGSDDSTLGDVSQ